MEERRYKRQQRRKRRQRNRLIILTAGAVILVLLFLWLCFPGLLGQPARIGRSTAGGVDRYRGAQPIKSLVLDAPFLDQREEYPTGCESVSAVMALQYFGVEVGVEEFIDGYLPLGSAPYEDLSGRLVGCDPREAFPGDPRTEGGWGCYAPVIEKALNDLLSNRSDTSRLTVENATGKTLPELCTEYVAKGIPVILWATMGMDPPEEYLSFFIEDTGEEFRWIYPMHCLLLIGWDEDGYFFNDPAAGKNQFYSREAAGRAYDGLGRQALALVPVD